MACVSPVLACPWYLSKGQGTDGWGEKGSETGNCQSSETTPKKRAESQPSGAFIPVFACPVFFRVRDAVLGGIIPGDGNKIWNRNSILSEE